MDKEKKTSKNRITHEKFVAKIYSLVGNDYTVLSEYMSSKEKVLMRHNKCGNEFWIRASHFTSSGSRCKPCSFKGINGKSHEQFIKDVYEKVGNEYTVLGKYKKAHEKVKIRHNTCGHEYLVDPASFLYGSRCRECNRKILGDLKRKNHNDFVKECEHLVGNEYTVLSEYTATHIHVKMRHNDCGYEFDIMPSNFLRGRECPNCKGEKISKKKTHSHNEFEERVFELVGDEYKVLGTYERARKKILMQHMICGYKYEVAPYHFARGTRCPMCNESKGERAIKEYLESINFKFEKEYSFPDCKNVILLRFDFAVFNKDGSLLCLIEYDGEQHFEPVHHFGGDKEFKLRKQRDQIKNKYCHDNNLNLIRISYHERDITSILDKKLRYKK